MPLISMSSQLPPPKYDRNSRPILEASSLTLQEVLNLKDSSSNCYKLKTYAFGLQVQFDELNVEKAELGKELDAIKELHEKEIKYLKESYQDELAVIEATHREEVDRIKDSNMFDGYDEMKALLESAIDDRDRTIQTLTTLITDLENRLDTATTSARNAENMCEELLGYVGK